MKEKWESDHTNDNYRFQYACALSKSGGVNAETEKREAIGHFDYLVQHGVFPRDSMYNLALTEYFLAEYEFALAHCEELYRQDPDNKQVRECRSCITQPKEYSDNSHPTLSITGEAPARCDQLQAQAHAGQGEGGQGHDAGGGPGRGPRSGSCWSGIPALWLQGQEINALHVLSVN